MTQGVRIVMVDKRELPAAGDQEGLATKQLVIRAGSTSLVWAIPQALPIQVPPCRFRAPCSLGLENI
jgi:hypothetical protein